ncbi:hypothetical protein BH160DRAFT_2108 [Burkholderia sp. H160]|nr:hypothetical protein BH160DRAFT_2108 [Burkholderia sp. H160]
MSASGELAGDIRFNYERASGWSLAERVESAPLSQRLTEMRAPR